MGVATITAYTESRREAVEIEKDAGAVLVEAGAKVEKVNVLKLEQGDYGKYVAKVQFLGEFADVIAESSLSDLACEIWSKVGDYCWLHIFVTDGKDEVQEKFDRSDYRELMGE